MSSLFFFNQKDQFSQLPIHLSFLLRQATASGYTVTDMAPACAYHLYQITHPHSQRQMYVAKTNSYSDQSLVSHHIAQHKYLTYLTFKNQLKMPTTHPFTNITAALRLWQEKFDQQPVVMKAENQDLGVDIFIGVKKQNQIKDKARYLSQTYPHQPSLMQEMITGTDLRVQAVGGQLFAACVRKPANVIGDGVHTIAQLIAQKNQTKIIFNPQNKIVIDAITLKLLREQSLSLQSIPPQGLKVVLKKAANIGLGGDPIDVTTQLDESFNHIIKNIAARFQVATFALDFMVKGKIKSINNAYLLEINTPCMWAHHHFAEGQKRNVALAILDAHFHPKNFNPKNKKYLL